jgi:transcriptional regulator with XRE-family HTH domain
MEDLERRMALADFLRTRRARLSPADVGLPWGSRRRTPGLRREEIAQLANVGTSWYVALEQGRDVRPSGQVLDSLAQALRLTAAERRHLFQLAQTNGSTLPTLPPEEKVSTALEHAVQALHPHPAYVLGRRWDLLTWNRAAERVFAFSEIMLPHSRNFIWRSFTNAMLRTHHNWDKLAQSLIAQFRADYARYPGDPWFGELIEDLGQGSEEFKLWWSRHDVRSIPDGHKHMQHPTLGLLDFEHVTLQVPMNPDLKVILYTCTSDTYSKLND